MLQPLQLRHKYLEPKENVMWSTQNFCAVLKKLINLSVA